MPPHTGQDGRSLYRIGELAEMALCVTKTIVLRVSRQIVSTYCMYGLVQEAARTPGGHRLFDASTARRIQLIRELKQRYTLGEIREIFIRDRF